MPGSISSRQNIFKILTFYCLACSITTPNITISQYEVIHAHLETVSQFQIAYHSSKRALDLARSTLASLDTQLVAPSIPIENDPDGTAQAELDRNIIEDRILTEQQIFNLEIKMAKLNNLRLANIIICKSNISMISTELNKVNNYIILYLSNQLNFIQNSELQSFIIRSASLERALHLLHAALIKLESLTL